MHLKKPCFRICRQRRVLVYIFLVTDLTFSHSYPLDNQFDSCALDNTFLWPTSLSNLIFSIRPCRVQYLRDFDNSASRLFGSNMADREPPPITLTTTTTAPTVQTATTYTIGNRRSRGNSNPNRPNNGNLQLPQQNDNTEPFPALQYPSAPLRQTRSNNTDYFAQPSLQYQAGTRPIGIRRLPSGTDTAHSGSDREKNGISLRRRAHTGPSSRPQSQSDNAFADLAALPSHYEVGLPGGMGTIVEGQEAHHGQQNVDLNSNQAQAQHGGLFDSEAAGVGRSGSRRLRAASNAAKSVFSKMSDDTEEPNLRSGRAQGRNNGNYESDVVDYLDVLGKQAAYSSRDD